MISANAAETLILDLTLPLTAAIDQETVALNDALGRVLAVPVSSPLDFPYWDNSAMDGYAVRYADVAAVPTTLTVIEEIAAGRRPQKTLESGQAARIFTGGMLPAGADTIVIQEQTVRQGDRVQVLTVPSAEAFVRHRGSFYQAGAVLLTAGMRLQAPEIAVLAAAQRTQVSVYRRPRVAILSTGDELVEPDQPLQPGQIVDSNQFALRALVAQMGAIPITLGIVPDQPAALRAAIAQALAEADLVLSSGGVSVGDYDYIEGILVELGATLHIQTVAVKPGKPLTVATAVKADGRSILYFGLPGNPASSLVGFWRFVQPALRKLSGETGPWHPHWGMATTLSELRADGKRETYLWGHLTFGPGGYEFQAAVGSQSSGNLVSLAGTNALAVMPVGETKLLTGQTVRVLIP